MRGLRRILVCHGFATAFALGAACEGSNAPAPAAAAPFLLRVAGEYATAVELRESSCPGIAVEPRPTTVEHAPGATEIVLRHAGLAYEGTVRRDGTFTTKPHPIDAGDATHTLSISGRFSRTGFTAKVEADVRKKAEPATCRYVVEWVGTKQGEPNQFPGS